MICVIKESVYCIIISFFNEVDSFMDILSFALYHENIQTTNGTESQHDGGVDADVASSPPRLEGDDEHEAKRMRFNDTEDSTTTSTGNTDVDIATRRWKEVVSTDGEGRELDDLCKDITDREAVRHAVDIMAKKDKVMLSDGVVYQL